MTKFMSVCSELNDAFAESEMKIRSIPHELPQQDMIERYSQSNHRLILLVNKLVLGDFNLICILLLLTNCEICFRVSVEHSLIQWIVEVRKWILN